MFHFIASALLMVTSYSAAAARGAAAVKTTSTTGTSDPAGSAVSVNDFIQGTYVDFQGRRLPYRLFVPRGLTKDQMKKVPLVLFLHGAGGRGIDNRGQISDQDAALVFVKPENQARWPLFMVAPQCPPDQQWVDMPWGTATGNGRRPQKPTWPLAAAMALVDQLRHDHPAIDAQRLHVTGISMGGYGTWDAIARHPTRWKSAAIICGGYDVTAVDALAGAKLPVWVFHAADDSTVPVSRSREMIAALRALGSQPRYTEYSASDRHGHFSWLPAYADPQLLPWMFGPPLRTTPSTPTRPK